MSYQLVTDEEFQAWQDSNKQQVTSTVPVSNTPVITTPINPNYAPITVDQPLTREYVDMQLEENVTPNPQVIEAKQKFNVIDEHKRLYSIAYEAHLGNPLMALRSIPGYFGADESSIVTKDHTIYNADSAKYINERGAELRQYQLKGRENILDNLYKLGIKDAEFDADGKLYANVEGKKTLIDSDFWDQVSAGKYNTMLTMIGGIGGAKVGGKLGNLPGTAGKIGRPLGVIGGSVIGGMTGGGAGRFIDLMKAETQLQDDYELVWMIKESMDAGKADMIFGLLGEVGFQGSATVMKRTIKGLSKGYDLVVRGNAQGAKETLEAISHLTPEQTNKILQNFQSKVTMGTLAEDTISYKLWDKLGKIPGLKNISEKKKQNFIDGALDKETASVLALVMTQPGYENFFKNIVAMNPKTASKFTKLIQDRSDNIVKLAKEGAPVQEIRNEKNLFNILDEATKTYKAEIDDAFESTKRMVDKSVPNYKFDFDATILRPIQTAKRGTNVDPANINGVIEALERIKANYADRDISDLLDMRVNLNKAIAGSGITKDGAEYKVLQKGLDSIDLEIDNFVSQLANHNPDLAKSWKKTWDDVRLEYGQLKEIEDGLLIKKLNSNTVSNEDIYNTVQKIAYSESNEFGRLLSKLNKDVRSKVERGVVDKITQLHTYTSSDGATNYATNFPGLAKALQGIDLKDPHALRIRKLAEEYGEIFRADTSLMWYATNGNAQLPKFQSFLTTDPMIRLKYEIASQVFNTVRSRAPTEGSAVYSIHNTLKRALKNPLDHKAMEGFMGALPENTMVKPYIAEQTKILQQSFAQHKAMLKEQFKREDIPASMVTNSMSDITPKGVDTLTEELFKETTISTKKIESASEQVGSLLKHRAKLKKIDFNNAEQVEKFIKNEIKLTKTRMQNEFKVSLDDETIRKALIEEIDNIKTQK